MKSLRIGHVYPTTVEDSGGKLFQMSPALFFILLGRRQETYSGFSGVFQKLRRLKWLSDAADPLLTDDLEYYIYPPVLQGYMLAHLGCITSLTSLSLQFERNMVISDNHTHHFTASFSNLTSISFIGAFHQVRALDLQTHTDPYIFKHADSALSASASSTQASCQRPYWHNGLLESTHALRSCNPVITSCVLTTNTPFSLSDHR